MTFITTFALRAKRAHLEGLCCLQCISHLTIKQNIHKEIDRGFIKGQAPGKLTGCERDLAINLPGCFRLLFLLSFIRKTKNTRLKNPTDLLHKILMKPSTKMVGQGNE